MVEGQGRAKFGNHSAKVVLKKKKKKKKDSAPTSGQDSHGSEDHRAAAEHTTPTGSRAADSNKPEAEAAEAPSLQEINPDKEDRSKTTSPTSPSSASWFGGQRQLDSKSLQVEAQRCEMINAYRSSMLQSKRAVELAAEAERKAAWEHGRISRALEVHDQRVKMQQHHKALEDAGLEELQRMHAADRLTLENPLRSQIWRPETKPDPAEQARERAPEVRRSSPPAPVKQHVSPVTAGAKKIAASWACLEVPPIPEVPKKFGSHARTQPTFIEPRSYTEMIALSLTKPPCRQSASKYCCEACESRKSRKGTRKSKC